MHSKPRLFRNEKRQWNGTFSSWDVCGIRLLFEIIFENCIIEHLLGVGKIATIGCKVKEMSWAVF